MSVLVAGDAVMDILARARARAMVPVLGPELPIWVLTPNHDELGALGGTILRCSDTTPRWAPRWLRPITAAYGRAHVR
ncbi:MAG: hypothetical protein ACK5MP_11285 [Nostocoides sp.]